jgi:hypothetical protein
MSLFEWRTTPGNVLHLFVVLPGAPAVPMACGGSIKPDFVRLEFDVHAVACGRCIAQGLNVAGAMVL